MRLRTRSRAVWSERRLYLQAIVLVPVIRLALFVLPLHRVRWMLSAVVRMSRRTQSSADVNELKRVPPVVAAVARAVPRATCLVQALAVRALFEMRRSEARVCIGVRRGPGGFAAHAWVETADTAIVEQQESGYRALAVFDRLSP